MANEPTQACNSKPTENQCNCKLTYTLIQQTPLIHFQPNQQGATLRASEVKPKLDRWLLSHCTINDQWKISKDKNALNYKMRIEAEETELKNLGPKTDYDIYYGNMGNGNEKVFGVHSNSITLEIICFDEKLRKLINDNLSTFFIVHNFGRMQNKGFGSFVLGVLGSEMPSESDVAKALKDEYKAKIVYCFDSDTKNNLAFKQIKTIYSLMKSGINLSFKDPPKYRRSLLFNYMKTYKIGDEKAWLKREGLAPIFGSNEHKDQHIVAFKNEECKYVRALMGIGDHLTFKSDKGNKTITIKSDEIERFASTVFFKVIENRVYYVGKRIDAKIFNKEFLFSSNYNYEKKLSTPEIVGPDFMDGFLEYCFKKFNDPDDGGTKMEAFPNMKNVNIMELKGGQTT